MGRKRKYFTEEEKKQAQKKWQSEHYERPSKRKLVIDMTKEENNN